MFIAEIGAARGQTDRWKQWQTYLSKRFCYPLDAHEKEFAARVKTIKGHKASG
jgi:hypothetical protein